VLNRVKMPGFYRLRIMPQAVLLLSLYCPIVGTMLP